MTREPANVSRAAQVAAANLRIDSMTAAVLRTFEAGDVHSILLKGPSVARWLFADDRLRAYSDADLLVRPSDLAVAQQLLRDGGFVPTVDEREMPAWWHEHAMSWQQADSGLIVDLHRTLSGVGVDDDLAWSILAESQVSLDVGGMRAPVLSVPARALHIALHAAQHDVTTKAVLRDLDRALEVVDDATWQAAAGLATQLRAVSSMAVGLRRRPAGRELATRLELPETGDVNYELRAAMAVPEALTMERLASASTVRERAAIVRHKLAPPATFMRRWSALARRGRAGLGLAYAHRLVWMIGRAGPAIAAWRRARRRVNRP